MPRQWDTWTGAMASPMVTESKPRRPWQNTMGFWGERSTAERMSQRVMEAAMG